MKKITLLVLFLSTLWGYSQVKNYAFLQTTGTYSEISGGTVVGNSSTVSEPFVDPAVPLGTAGIYTGPGLPIGFNFIFNGYSYDKFAIHPKGWITLGSSAFTPAVNTAGATAGPLSWTTAVSPEMLSARIAALAADIQAQAGSELSYLVKGSAPERILTIQWKNYRRAGIAGDLINFQIVLHETSNVIDFVYGSFSGTVATSKSCQVGLRAEPSSSAINFFTRATQTDWAATAVGVAGNSTATLTNAIKPFSGLTFTWTPPTCYDPKGLVSSTVTTNSATFAWGAPIPAPTDYEYVVSTSAAAPAGSGTFTENTSVAVSDLAPNTKYSVFVRSVCGSQFGQWINIVNFKTKCLDVTSYTENFDSYTVDYSSVANCWEKAGNGSCYVDTGGAIPGTAPNRFRMDATGGSTVSYAILPPVSNLNSGTYRLKFKVYATTANRTFDVGYCTDINDISTFKVLQTIDLPSTVASSAQEFAVYPPTTIPNGVKNLVFKNAGTGNGITSGTTTLYIDDVSWQLSPPCTDLKKVGVKSPTSTSVQLSWDVTGTETAWQYAVGSPTVVDPSTLPAGSFFNIDLASVTVDAAFPNTRTFTVTNLTPSTSYKIWIRSKCGEGDYGLWTASPVFLMPCSTVATIDEGFEAGLTTPDCWLRVANGTGTLSVVASQGSGSSNALELKSPSSSIAVFVSVPPLSTATTAGYRMRFKYKTLNAGSKLDIICFTQPLKTDVINYTPLKSITTGTANTEFVVSEAFIGTETPYLGFRYYSATGTTAIIYIDDFVWEPVPACPDVTALSVAGITGQSVGLGWTASGVENEWQYALGTPAATNPSTLTAVNFSEPSVNGTNITGSVSNLTPSTSYKVWIRSKCSNGSLGSWMGPVSFKTNCQGEETFTEKFDASVNFPSCWNKVGSANALVVAQTGTSSPNVLKIEGSTTSVSTKGIVAMQPVINAADGTHILRFKLSGSAVGAKVELGYLTNPSDPNKFISLNKFFTVGSTTAFSNESANLGYEVGSQVLAFRNPGTSATITSVYIDDVVWEPLPSCLDISGLVSTAVTGTTVGLSWKKGGTEGSWQYSIGNSSATAPGTAVNFVSPAIDDLNVSSTITGLTPSTPYRVWVRSKCSSSVFGVWVGPYDFTTTCAPTDKFTEKFDANTNLPACWNKVGTAGTVAIVAQAGGSTPNALKLESNATAKAIVAMKPLNNAGATTHRLRFKFRSNTANANIHIGYLTNIADPASFKLVESIVAPAKDVYYNKAVNLGDNPTSELLAFKNPDASIIYIDDVIWEPLPNCPELSALAVVKSTSTHADLQWTVGGSETEWQYALGTSTDVDPDLFPAMNFVAPVVTGSNVVGAVGNLAPSTSYKLWIRSKCGSSFGLWTDPVTFATTCVPANTITEKFDANTNIPSCWIKIAGTVAVEAFASAASTPNALKLSTTNALIAMPALANAAAGTHWLRFKFRSSLDNKNIQVGYLTNLSDPSSFQVVQTLNAPAKDVFYSRKVFLGTSPTSQILAFRNADATPAAIYIDDVVWEPLPSCPDISGLALASTPTLTTASIKWTMVGSETAWQYALGNPLDTDPTKLSPVDFVSPVITGKDVSVNLTGLTLGTAYKIWVRPNCGLGSFGEWNDVPLSFATACDPTITAFANNFDTTVTGELPPCWNKVGTFGIGKASVYAGAPSGTSLLVINSASTAERAVVAMPMISNAAAGTHRLRFKIRGSKDSVPFEVGYLTDITKDASFVVLQEATTGLMTQYNTTIASFATPPLSQILAFRNPGKVSGGSSIYIDDVVWEPIPTCSDVKELTASATSNSATIGWTAGDAETAWEYVKGGAAVTDPTTLTAVEVTSKTLTLTDLPSSTTYKIWVRSKCEATIKGAWIGPITFATTCAPITDFSQKFDDGITMPSCWTQVSNYGIVTIDASTSDPSQPNHLTMTSINDISRAVVAMPPVINSAAGAYRLRFKSKGLAANTAFELGYLTNIADPLSFVKLENLTAVSTTSYGSHTILLGNKPLSQVLAFRNPGLPKNEQGVYVSVSVYIDDVIWEPIPPCTDMKEVTVKLPTSNSVQLSFDTTGTETAWQYAYAPSTVASPSALPPTSIFDTDVKTVTVGGLSPNTSYKIWVRSNCGSATYGNWTESAIFTTPCASVATIAENFETGLTLPDCWRKIGTNGTAAVVASDSNALELTTQAANSAMYAAIPSLSNAVTGGYKMKFKYKSTATSSKIELICYKDLTNPTSVTVLKTITVAAANTEYAFDEILGATETPHLGLRVSNSSSVTTVFIDDFGWELPLPITCATGITVAPDANCGNRTNAISWTADPNAAGYKLTIGTTAGGSDVLNNKELGKVTTYSFSGKVNTAYYFTLKPWNVLGDATGCAEQTFTTAANGCYCTSVPASNEGTGITKVQIGASDFLNGDVTYKDFTANPVNFAQGVNSNLKITFGTSYAYNCNVWVDFNDNYDFEPSEIVFTGKSGSANPSTLNASFMMPATAQLGAHRMRIGAAHALQTPENPCYSGTYGVTLDFKVNIVAPAAIANDEPVGAVALTTGQVFATNAITGTNLNATGSVLEPAPGCGNYNGMDVWYKAVVPASGSITFEVNSVSGGLTNTAAAVYSGTPSNLVLVGCDDSSSATGKNVDAGDQPKISMIGRTPGEVLYLRVWENGGDAFGAYQVSSYDSAALGADNFGISNFSFYPNPVRDVLNISLDKEITDVAITNLLGQQVFAKSVDSNQVKIDMSDLAAGTYLVRVTADNQSKTIKVVKE